MLWKNTWNDWERFKCRYKYKSGTVLFTVNLLIGMLNRLVKKCEKTEQKASGVSIAQKVATQSRHEHNIEWEKCMFCKKSEGKNLKNLMTMTLSGKILSMAEQHAVNVSNLVAAEGKYHVQCWVKFQRTISRSNLKAVGPKKK